MSKVIYFEARAWDDYLYWQKIDKKMVKRINNIIKDVQRTPYNGIGKPEALRYELAGFWSRRINDEQRIIYRVIEENIVIAQCRLHH